LLGLTRQMTTHAESKEFEQLVARIEQAAAPRGAVVKWNERIPDIQTGTPRQYDVTIRHKVGTVDILVVIEVRKRKEKDDVTWLGILKEQREAAGASKIIGVSASGFSKELRRKAKLSAIELRTLSQISEADIEGWFLPGGAVHVFRLIEDIRCFVVLYEDSGEPSEYGFWAPSVEDPVCYEAKTKSPFAVRDYLPLLEATHPELFFGVPFDGTKVELEFPIHWNRGELQVATTDGRKDVHLLKLVANVSYQSAVCDLKTGVHHEYSNSEGTRIQHTAFNTELFGLPVKFEHQSDAAGNQKVSCKFSQGESEAQPSVPPDGPAAASRRQDRG